MSACLYRAGVKIGALSGELMVLDLPLLPAETTYLFYLEVIKFEVEDVDDDLDLFGEEIEEQKKANVEQEAQKAASTKKKESGM
ncbi:hypothetical protein GOP47_0027750 [Adiantum capillus-veneris]|nr:hypothetical protein GOP47_0027750 [Adiantum capillus-veneris]